MKEIIGIISGLGVPGLVLVIAMALTGFAGAAAITAALAALGGPFGMLGGIAALGILSLISKALAEIGVDALFDAVLDNLLKEGRSIDDIRGEVKGYPIPGPIKSEILRLLEERGRSSRGYGQSGPRRLRAFEVNTPELEARDSLEIQCLDDNECAVVEILSQSGADAWTGRVLNGKAAEPVLVLFVNRSLDEFNAPSSSLQVGESYRLESRHGGDEQRVLILRERSRGFWSGSVRGEDGLETLVNVFSRKTP
jgi:hypothetical protein